MEEDKIVINKGDNLLDVGMSSVGNTDDDNNSNSDEDESFKSCAEPISSSQYSLLTKDENNKAATGEQVEDNNESGLRTYPPEMSDDSDETFSENGSNDLYYSEVENNENDSDISNPSRDNVSTTPGEIEISFQRELLDYLGSFFNVESRFRLRENRQSAVNVSDDQLSEYRKLRNKVNQEMKVLGVGSSKDLASSAQNIGRNLYNLLTARERGDWTSCRRYSRIVPMWSFEKREMLLVADDQLDGQREKDVQTDDCKEPCKKWMKIQLDKHEKTGEDEDDDDDEDEDIKDRRTNIKNNNNNMKKKKNNSNKDVDMECSSTVSNCDNINRKKKVDKSEAGDMSEAPNSPNAQSSQTDSNCRQERLVFKNTQEVRYLRDAKKKRSQVVDKLVLEEQDDDDNHETISPNKEETKTKKKTMREVLTYERVQRNGVWDIKSAVYGSRWSVRRLGLETRFRAHDGCVNALDFSSSGNWIASGSDDRYIVITDWQQKQQLSRFTVGHSSNIFQVRFLPGSNDMELVSCSRDSSVRYAALSSTGQLQYSRVLTRHKECCHKMDVPIDQPCLVISAGEDTRVLGSDVRAQHSIGKICSVDKVPLYTISCNPVRSQEFAVAGKDSRVFIYDRRKPSLFLHQLCPDNLDSKPRSSYHVTSVAYSKNGESVLASYNDEDIYLLSTCPTDTSPVALHRYQGHRNVQTVTGVAFYGPQHEYVVSGSNDGHVLLWERETEALVNWFRADENGVVNVLEPHPSMPILATAGLDHDIKMWSMLGADGLNDRSLPLDLPLLEHDAETSRIDYAWKKLDEQVSDVHQDEQEQVNVPFNLRNLKVITALNWKMREEAYPYSIDNNLDNLIFMSRRRRGENQFRGIFISDSDSADSYDSAPDMNDDGSTAPGSSERNAGNSTSNLPRSNRDRADNNRPDGCRSS